MRWGLEIRDRSSTPIRLANMESTLFDFEEPKYPIFDISEILANYFKEKGLNFGDSSNDGSYERHKKKNKKKHKRKKEKHSHKKKRDKCSDDESERKIKHGTHRHHHHRHRRRSKSPNEHSHEKRRCRTRSRSSNRDRSKTSDDFRGFNKSELLEVARRNVKIMYDSGTLPKGVKVDPEKLGLVKELVSESVEKYTEIFRKLQKDTEAEADQSGTSARSLNHPFTLKERPIVLNIPNATPLPIQTSKEKILSAQFPVSCGSTHREKELEWTPVDKPPPVKEKKTKPNPKTEASETSNQEKTIVPPEDPDKELNELKALTIAQVTKKRFEALTALQKNPLDEASKRLHKLTEIVISEWNANQKQKHFGELNYDADPDVRFLSPAELQNGPQAWVRKDQFLSTKAVNSGIGMKLLRKMGWTPGTALGKNREGALEPLLLAVKVDRKGLVAAEEAIKKNPQCLKPNANRSANESAVLQRKINELFQGKHPVTLMLEICNARKIPHPVYIDLPALGEPHERTFLCECQFNKQSFIPTERSLTKKLAKAQAALLALTGSNL